MAGLTSYSPLNSLILCRFFCGPNAKKSAALAKQQKKRPRGDDKGKGKQVALDADSDEESAEDSGARISEEAVLPCWCKYSSICLVIGTMLKGANSTPQGRSSL